MAVKQGLLDFADVSFTALPGDLNNVAQHLPKLYPTQQEDVARCENWLLANKAYMFTNGTGTGKTFVGLGVAARFYARGMASILIVVPTDKKAKDWVKDGSYLDLTVRQLDDTRDSFGNIVVTTYANFYQNKSLESRHFDLIIYDECHYLNQNAQGAGTSYFEAHEKVAKLPRVANRMAISELGPYPNYEQDPTGARRRAWDAAMDRRAKEIWLGTKVVFLSATPFAYHKSIQYADGTLWHFSQHVGNHREERTGDYNEAVGFDKFLVERFGYSMRTGKCTRPDVEVDQGILERKLFEDSVKEGFMSTRQLFLDKDYSREFIQLDSTIGYRLDEGMKLMASSEFQQEYRYLFKYGPRHFTYIFKNQLLEMIKAKQVIPRIEKHLALNRKVCIYHSYNDGHIRHPFRFDAQKMLKGTDRRDWDIGRLQRDIMRFNENYPEYYNMDLHDLKNVRQTIAEHFPGISVEFNGKVTSSKRLKNVEAFLKDNGEVSIIVVQVKAGKEGISFHDTSGIHQRVLITLGLPTAPTDAIQIEGRIYREGVRTNAVYEYITLQTSFEAIAFADKIATRSKTAENLAMGNLARDLETSFREGYQNFIDTDPHTGQGFGGVEDDKDIQVVNLFDKACTFFYMKKKRNSKTKSAEGTDYFATPEPLGLKMVEWLALKDGDAFLEPSAGDGAIGRWAKHTTHNKFVEASYELSSKLALNVTGDVIHQRFEDFHIMNKFDGIAMNPPFGYQSKTAAEHVLKAALHLRSWGRLLAIVPASEQFNKKFKRYLAEHRSPLAKNMFVTAMIKLPSCLFERAGTSVMCNLIKIVHVPPQFAEVPTRDDVKIIDLTWCKNLEMFFAQIEFLEF